MVKKPKKAIIVGCSLAILIIIAIICIFKGESNDRVIKMYKKICNSQKYTFSMEENTTELNYKVLISKKDTDVCIDMYSNNEHNTTLVLENESYYIMHNDKEYFNLGEENVDSDILISSLKNISANKYISGKEEIYGNIYYYEEYDNNEMDFIIFANINESSTVKTRLYFKGNDICFIKNIIQNEDSEQEELIKVNLSYSVDENIFKLPESYSEVEN